MKPAVQIHLQEIAENSFTSNRYNIGGYVCFGFDITENFLSTLLVVLKIIATLVMPLFTN